MPSHKQHDIDSEIDFSEIYDRNKVELDDNLDNTVVVDNVPVVDDAKYDKLCTVLKKIFKPAGNIINLHMPKDAKSKTKG
jgi:translation initiation factor 3 subunit B